MTILGFIYFLVIYVIFVKQLYFYLKFSLWLSCNSTKLPWIAPAGFNKTNFRGAYVSRISKQLRAAVNRAFITPRFLY
jgi:hypothetical protein